MAEVDRDREADVRGWLVWFGISTAATVVIILFYSATPLPAALASAGAVVAVQVLYFATCRPDQIGIRRGGVRAWIWAIVAVIGLGVAVLFDSWAAASLFALTPQVILLLSPPWSTVIVIALNAVALVVRLLVERPAADAAMQAVGTSVFIVVFSLFLSARMREITRRSRERQALIDQLREREAEVAALSAARGAAQERTRIAREMHDTLAQGFTSIVTLGNAALGELDADPVAARRHVELVTATARDNLAESRRIIAALAPAALGGDSLEDAIVRVIRAFEAESGIPVSADLHAASVSPATAVVALRVVQEALANIRRHAHAHRASVQATVDAGMLTLEIADNGRGFGADAAQDGYGLSGLRGRVADVGGRVDVRSAPGAGTVVAVELPVPSVAFGAEASP